MPNRSVEEKEKSDGRVKFSGELTPSGCARGAHFRGVSRQKGSQGPKRRGQKIGSEVCHLDNMAGRDRVRSHDTNKKTREEKVGGGRRGDRIASKARYQRTSGGWGATTGGGQKDQWSSNG